MALTKGALTLRDLIKPTPPPMTQKGLAEALGVTQQAVSAWLRGATRPSYETRLKIEKLLGVPVDSWTEPATDGGARRAS